MKKFIVIALLLLLPFLSFGQEGGINRGLISGPNFIPSLVGTTTWGSGSTFTWTFDAGTTDPTFTFGSGTLVFGGGVFTFPNVGLTTYDTNASHYLIFKPGSDLTGNKTLTFTTGDADRTIILSGNPTLADWFDQAIKTTSSPTFSGLTLKTVTKTFADTGYTALSTDFSIIWNAVGGACTQNLPAATGTGRILEIKKVDASANTVTIDGNAAELIDGATTIVLTAQWEAITIQDTAAGVWHIL